jgi:hypothetical protein
MYEYHYLYWHLNQQYTEFYNLVALAICFLNATNEILGQKLDSQITIV